MIFLKNAKLILFIILFINSLTSYASPIISNQSISIEAGLKIAQKGLQTARQLKCDAAIAVVDQGGNVLVIIRDDNGTEQFVTGATRKAWTALNLKNSTKEILTTIKQGYEDNDQLPFIEKSLFLYGGVPLKLNNKMVGAVGAGGCINGEDDDKVAKASANEFYKLTSNLAPTH
jgi:uncharacterized protein GlcG (DUF336 family)